MQRKRRLRSIKKKILLDFLKKPKLLLRARKLNWRELLPVFKKHKVKKKLPINLSLRRNVGLRKSALRRWPKWNNRKLLMLRELKQRKLKLKLKLPRRHRQLQKHVPLLKKVSNH
jgi:hypothetical protein